MRIGIIGTGLIGGSLGLSLKNSGKDYHISCWNRREDISRKAIKLKACDDYYTSIAELVANSDVIVICTPLSSYTQITEQIIPALTSEKIIIDIGSVKSLPSKNILKALPSKYKGNFISAHPIAGKEKGGIENAEAKLFRNKTIYITSLSAPQKNVKVINNIWKAAGSRTRPIKAAQHDIIYAHVSHYVQYLSFILKDILPHNMGEFSRLMRSPEDIWQEIFKFNSSNLKKINRSYIRSLQNEMKKIRPVKARDANHAAALILVSCFIRNTPPLYRKYAGTGYKSFTSIVSEANKGNRQIEAEEVRKILTKVLHELKKAKF